jgi:putative transposase
VLNSERFCTKIAGPHKWTWFHLYVMLDVWSRFAVGWLVAPRESARLADLGVTGSHSRPHVSNDNPFSEAQFKTLKTTPRFPERFASLAHARTFTDEFFDHYNHHHRHSGIGYHTPASVHLGHHTAIRAHRQAVLDHAYAADPTAFTADQPHPPSPGMPGSTNPNRICLRSHPWSRAMTVPSCSPRWSGGSAPAGHLAARRPLHASR